MRAVVIFILIISVSAVILAQYKSGHLVKGIFKTMFQGLISLIAVNVTGLATGVTLSVNWYTLSAVTIFGLPGTITLTIMKLIFKQL